MQRGGHSPPFTQARKEEGVHLFWAIHIIESGPLYGLEDPFISMLSLSTQTVNKLLSGRDEKSAEMKMSRGQQASDLLKLLAGAEGQAR